VATEWLERYRGFWEGRYQKLDALLDSLVAKEKRPLRVSSKPIAGKEIPTQSTDHTNGNPTGQNHQEGTQP
jgi:hypothetical protein